MTLRTRIERLERALPSVTRNGQACAMCGGMGEGAAIILTSAEELPAWYALDGCPLCGRGLVLIPDHGRDPAIAAVVMAHRTLAPPAPPGGAPDLAALTRMTHAASASTTPAPAPSTMPVPTTGRWSQSHV
jgi:hypothetical protein